METTLSIIGIIVDLVIGVIGAFIAIMQYRIDKREADRIKQEEQRMENERETITVIARNTQVISKFTSAFNEELFPYIKKANNEGWNENDIQGYINIYTYISEKWPAIRDNVYCLYKKMLENEEKFSLSYGYERYINAFREFLFDNEEYTGFSEFINVIKQVQSREGAELTDDDRVALKITADKANSDAIQLANKINKLKPFLEELLLKYDSVTIETKKI